MKVAMLTGCVQRLAFGHVNEATVRVLVGRGLPGDGAGRRRAAAARCRCTRATSIRRARWRRRTIEVFEQAGADRIVVNAAGCGSAMKDYGELFADDPAWATRAHAFSARVRDVSQVLAELGPPRAPRHPIAARVAYHDACHLAHGQGVRAEPRALLQAHSGRGAGVAGGARDLLRQRRHLQPGAAGAGGGPRRSQSPPPRRPVSGYDRDRQSGLHAADRRGRAASRA